MVSLGRFTLTMCPVAFTSDVDFTPPDVATAMRTCATQRGEWIDNCKPKSLLFFHELVHLVLNVHGEGSSTDQPVSAS